MAPSAIFANLKRPQTTLREGTFGTVTPNTASHSSIYVLGTATNTGITADLNTPVLLENLNDFSNRFGGSVSENYLKAIYDQDTNAEIFFVQVAVVPKTTITVEDSGDAVTYSFTLNGVEIEYTPTNGETNAEITEGLRTAFRASSESVSVNSVTGDAANEFILYPEVITYPMVITAETNVTSAVDLNATASIIDYLNTLDVAFSGTERLKQGFLIAPEAFQYLDISDHPQLVSAMEAVVSDKRRDWIAFVDSDEDVISIAGIQSQKEAISSPQGHTAFYSQYLTTDAANGELDIPSSPVAVGLYSAEIKEKGYHHAGAGILRPVRGITKIVREFGTTEQDALSESNINYFVSKANAGIYLSEIKPAATLPEYQQVPVRIVMNVVNGSLRSQFDRYLFEPVRGQLLIDMQNLAEEICRNIWRDGALFGESEEDAFLVRCNRVNNPEDQLELGNILLEVYVAPTPSVRKILIQTYRTAIGDVPNA